MIRNFAFALVAFAALSANNAFATNDATVCHGGNTLSVSSSALQAHLDHGDVPGACQAGGGQGGNGTGGQGGNGGSATSTNVLANAQSQTATGGAAQANGGSATIAKDAIKVQGGDVDVTVKPSFDIDNTNKLTVERGAIDNDVNTTAKIERGAVDNDVDTRTSTSTKTDQDQYQGQKSSTSTKTSQEQGQTANGEVDSHDIFDASDRSTTTFEAPELPVNAAAAAIGGSCNQGLSFSTKDASGSIGSGNDVCDFLAVARGYAAVGKLDKSVEVLDLALDAAKRRSLLAKVRGYLTLGLL